MLSTQEKQALLTCAHQAALQIKRPVSRALQLLRLALRVNNQDQHLGADELISEAVKISAKLDELDKGLVLAEIGYVYSSLKQEAKANSYFAQALRIADQSPKELQKCAILHRMAELQCHLGRFEDARVLAERLNDPAYRSTVLLVIAKSHVMRGDVISALETASGALEPSGLLSDAFLKLIEKDDLLALERDAVRRLFPSSGV